MSDLCTSDWEMAASGISDCLQDITLLTPGSTSAWVAELQKTVECDPMRTIREVLTLPWYETLTNEARHRLWALLLIVFAPGPHAMTGLRYGLEDCLGKDGLRRVLQIATDRIRGIARNR